MPLLKQLEEFKSSFLHVANEAQILLKSEVPPEKIELPDSDPPQPFPEGLEGTEIVPEPGELNIDDLDLGLDSGEYPDVTFDTPDTQAADTLPPETANDLGPIGDVLGDTFEDALAGLDLGGTGDSGLTGAGDFTADSGLTGGGDFNLDDLGISDTPAAPADTGLDDLNIDGISGLTMPDDTGADSADSGFEIPSLEEGIDLSESLDLGGEAPGSGFGVPMEDISGTAMGYGPKAASEATPFSTDNFPSSPTDSIDIDGFEPVSDLGESLDLGTESFDGTLAQDAGSGGFDLSGLGDISGIGGLESAGPAFGSPEEESAPFDAGADDLGSFDASAFDTGSSDTSSFDADSAGLGSDLGSMDDINPFGSGDLSDTASFDADSFDSAAGDAGPPMPETVLDTPDFSAPIEDGTNEFALHGIDDIPDPADLIAKSKPGIPVGAKAAKDDVEEINLTDAEYKQLVETLQVYPLNLRMACEEIIAEQAVAPDQMSALIRLLVRGAPARETAVLAGKILGRTITIPKGYTKQTGTEMEAEQGSFAYIFIHRFLPVLRIFAGIAVVALSLAYLCWQFIVIPIQAENLYKEGYTMLRSGEYTRANELFRLAFEKRRVKNWFYRYAEGFRDERQYIFAERKYDELLFVYPRDKKGALDYAAMETYYLRNYEKADRIIRNYILDYSVNDKEGLLALAENSLEWGETDPARYEEARSSYSRLIEKYGRKDPYLEGMLKYFIRTDKLNEVLPLQAHFMGKKKRQITVPTLAELGAYLLDKKFEENGGVPEEYADRIEGIRDILLRAIKEDSFYPESYYHLARYYRYYDSNAEERQTLKDAIKAFNAAGNETPKRAAFHVDAHRRLAEVLIRGKEFFPAEEEVIKGIRLYEDARQRQVLKTDSMFGRLYAVMGDLEYFVKDGNMEAALRYYREAEQNLWSPPEIQYRMGAAHYQLEQWDESLQRLFMLTPSMPNNRRLLYALGNVSFMRGNYFAAQGYYNRLIDILDMERVRFPNLTPDSRPEEKELTERIMVVENNLGVTLEALTRVSGDTGYRSRALGLFANSIRAWDVITRDPETMNRMRPFKDLYGPGVNLAYLNVRAITLSEPNYDPQIFMRIDRDCIEPSAWEDLVPRDYQLSDQLLPAAGE